MTTIRTLTIGMCTLTVLLSSVSAAQAYPPDNAALLYYRAFLVMKEPTAEVRDTMYEMRQGKRQSSDAIKQCVEENRQVIEILETAAAIGHCDWAREDRRGFDMLVPELAKVRLTVFLLAADAQILAEQGQYRAALHRCLTIHRMARHVGDDMLLSFLVGVSINTMANNRIRDVLSVMPPDVETLNWLKGEMVGLASRAVSVKVAMNAERRIAAHEIRRDRVDALLAVVQENNADQVNPETLARLGQGDERFFKDSRDYYTQAITDAIVTLGQPYLEAYQRLKAQNERVARDAEKNPAAIVCNLLAPTPTIILTQYTGNMTRFNATIAAIDVYLAQARSGRLPKTLPAGVPLDLFSHRDFVYEATPNGFVLRCQAKDLDIDQTHQYEFQVAK